MYKTEDYGIFLGLMTMPFGEEDLPLTQKIKQLFQDHKAQIRSNFSTAEVESTFFDEFLFIPKVYCLLDNFEFAVLSLADNFDLATARPNPISAPFSNGQGNDESQFYSNANFNIISGLVPDLSVFDMQELSLLERAKNTFLAEKNTLPFIGISSFKFNNELVIGGGGEFMELVLRTIQSKLFAVQKNENYPFEYVVFHSFSWHELNIIFFSNSYENIAAQVNRLRSLIMADLRNCIYEDTSNPRSVDGSLIESQYNRVFESSLLRYFLETGKGEIPDWNHLGRTRIFIQSNTTLGFDSDLLFKENDLNQFPEEDSLRLNLQLRFRPSQIDPFLQTLYRHKDNPISVHIQEKGRMIFGHGNNDYLIEGNSVKEFLEITSFILQSPLRKYIGQIDALPTFRYDGGSKLMDLSCGYSYESILSRLRFKSQEIEYLQIYLDTLRIPKLIQEDVSKMYTVFNDGISHPILYIYFIELRPYLEETLSLVEHLENYKNQIVSVNEITNQLSDLIEDFEIACRNRLGPENILGKSSSFNLKVNSGTQQLVSLFDSAYKTLTSLFGEGEFSRSIAFISRSPNLRSNFLSVSMNSYHINYPVFMAASLTHEAANLVPFRSTMTGVDEDDSIKLLFDQINSESDELEREHLHYFLVDIIAYYTTFAEDFELFQFWIWSTYIQIGIAYDTSGRLTQDLFNMVFTRLYLLAQLTGNSSFVNGAFYPPFLPLTRSLVKTWEAAYLYAKTEGEWFLAKNGSLLYTAQSLAMGFLLRDFFKGITDFDEEVIEQIIHEAFSKTPQTYDLIKARLSSMKFQESSFLNTVPVARQYYFRKIAEEIKQQLNEGKVISFASYQQEPLLQKVSDSFYLQALMHAYLQLVKSLSNDKIALLSRSVIDGRIEHHKLDTTIQDLKLTTNSSIWFDPLGGLFINSAASRAAHFRARSAFIKSLWDLSAKRKVKLFKEFFNHDNNSN